MKLVSGTFENGCGVIVEDQGNFYHLVVVNDCVTVGERECKKEDLENSLELLNDEVDFGL